MEPASNYGGAGVRWGQVWLDFEGVPHYPLCGCCTAQSIFAESHTHTTVMSNVGQRSLNFYIAAKEQ